MLLNCKSCNYQFSTSKHLGCPACAHAGAKPQIEKLYKPKQRQIPLARTTPPAPRQQVAAPVGPAPIQIEKTSKELKVHHLYGLAAIFIGIFMLFQLISVGLPQNQSAIPLYSTAVSASTWAILGGILYMIVTQFRIWWHHG